METKPQNKQNKKMTLIEKFSSKIQGRTLLNQGYYLGNVDHLMTHDVCGPAPLPF